MNRLKHKYFVIFLEIRNKNLNQPQVRTNAAKLWFWFKQGFIACSDEVFFSFTLFYNSTKLLALKPNPESSGCLLGA